MKNTLETRLGIFVILAVLAAIVILDILGGIGVFQRGYRLHAMFDTVQELKVGDRVKMAGVEVGRVIDIELSPTNNKVLVTMKMRAGTAVRTDSIATVKFTGLMSQNFVSIDFGKPGSPLATPDFLIKTEEQPDLSAIMVKLDKVATGVKNLTDTFTGDKIENLLGPFTDFLKANKGPLTATIANLQSVSSQIASGQGTVGMLIYSNTLYTSALDTISNLQGTAEEIKSTIADAHKTVDQINSGNGTVGKLLKDEKLYAEISASATNLREILEKVNKGDGTVGKLINDQEFYKSAKMTMQKLDQATEGLEDQGPLSVLGLALGKLF